MKSTIVIKYQVIEKGSVYDEIKETTLDDNINNYEDFIIIRSIYENRYKMFIRPKRDIRLIEATQTFKKHFNKKSTFFLNGYQSWTDSFEYDYNTKLKDSSKLPRKVLDTFYLDKYGETDFYKYQKNVLHAFDISYMKGINELFVGSLDYKHAFLIIEYHLKEELLVLKSDCYNQKVVTDNDYKLYDYVIGNRVDSLIKEYTNYFEPKTKKKLFGYCTWYNHYQNINEEIINNSIDNSYIHGSIMQYDLYQIDDGWEKAVGDWQVDTNKFPNGLKGIVEKIHEKKMKAGIWLAPFVVEEKSEIFKQHPDWLKKNELGKICKCGCNWSGFYALDLENENVRQYIEKSFRDLIDMGFDYFKLDFLYAINKGLYDDKSRCTITYESYCWIRSILKDKLINGCGGPLVPAASNFDYMRIGPDVSLKFDDVLYMHFMHRERISTKITMQNTIYRTFIDSHIFLNDPDVFVLRKDGNSLTYKQKECLLMINALYGSLLMTSDEISNYSEEERKLLDKALYAFYNAYDIDFTRLNKDEIKIVYNIKDMKQQYLYNTKLGILKGIDEIKDTKKMKKFTY